MSENKFIKDMLEHQKGIDSNLDTPSVRELSLEADKIILKKVLESTNSTEEAKMIQDAFDEYVRVGDEIYAQKGNNMRGIEDIREKIPENLWIKLARTNEVPEIDFDAVWKNIQKEVDWDKIRSDALQDEAEDAKKKGQIN